MTDIAFAVRLIRQAEQLTQKQLAIRAHLSNSTVRRIEQRVEAPPLKTILQCAKGLHVPASVLFTLACACAKTGVQKSGNASV